VNKHISKSYHRPESVCHLPLGEAANRIEQDVIWNAHLADIVQQCTPTNIQHLCVCEAKFMSQGQVNWVTRKV
jgi:hypothetical protein